MTYNLPKLQCSKMPMKWFLIITADSAPAAIAYQKDLEI